MTDTEKKTTSVEHIHSAEVPRSTATAPEPEPSIAPIPGMAAAIPVLMTYLAKYGATPILLSLFCFMLYSNWSDMRATNRDNSAALVKVADAMTVLAASVVKTADANKEQNAILERLNGAINRLGSKSSGKDPPPLFSNPGS